MTSPLPALTFILLFLSPPLLASFFLVPTRFELRNAEVRSSLNLLCRLWTLAFGLPFSALVAMGEGYIGREVCFVLFVGIGLALWWW